MTTSIDGENVKQRTKELLALFNEGRVDAVLDAYSDDVRFTLPIRPQIGCDVGMATGTGKASLRACLETMHRRFAPFRLLDVSGTTASRSVVLEDALGNRLLLTLEADGAGLNRDVFALRTRAGLQLAA